MRPSIFLLAKEILLKEGWIQHSYESFKGYCVIGACGCAMYRLGIGSGYGSFECSPDFMALRKAVDEITPQQFDEVYQWNDRPNRTLEEVVSVLDRAAQIAEGLP